MKKLLFISFLLSSYLTASAKVAPMSYVTIDAVNSTSTTVSLRELTINKKYFCDTISLACLEEGTTSPAFATSTTQEISFEEATNTYTHMNSEAESPREKSIPVPSTHIPSNAHSITPNPQKDTFAFYTTTGFYGTKSSRTFWMVSTSTQATSYFVETIPGELDLLSDAPRVFSWNASGTILVYLSDRNGYQQMYKVSTKQTAGSLEGSPLLTKKYTVLDFIVHGDTVYFIANKDNVFTYNLYKLSLAKNSSVEKIASDVMYTNDLAVSGSKLLFTKNNSGVGVLYAYDTTENKTIPFSNIDYSTVLVSTSTPISQPFFGRYYKGTKKGVAVIWLHGGPYRQSGAERHSWGSYAMYDWMLEEAHASGATILKLDYPGSFGYGKVYANKLVEKIGDRDISSLKNAISFLEKKGHTKIYLFGVSYGGYITVKGATDLPKKIAGGLAVAPVTDWKVLIERVSPTPFEVYFTNSKNQEALYKKANAVAKLSTKTPPLILMHGNKDTSVTFSQSLYLLSEASQKGLSQEKIKLFSLEGENHVLKDPTHIKNVCEQLKVLILSTTMSCEM